ncbi:MAG: TetR/AcrR family transcriptional regulator [Planctomycetes bacterium]|nr:TetR/AcrR family transcriptional regulator [Planctomycetota bacterium]
MATSGRERFIPIAAELFARQGFGPVSLDEVIAAAGVTKTTFYKHFDSKDSLILAVLAYQHELEMTNLSGEIARLGGRDPREQILAIFDTLDTWFADMNFRGCMFLNAATEFPHENDPIHKAALVHGEALDSLVREKCVEAGADAKSASEVAQQILLLITGAVISRHTAKQLQAARTARRSAELILGAMLPVEESPTLRNGTRIRR